MIRKPLIIANWKMKVPRSRVDYVLRALALGIKHYRKELEDYSFVACPSFESIDHAVTSIRKLRAPISVGAQDCFWETSGAYTGEVSPLTLEELGCTYCIVGHSERRTLVGETDAQVNKKVRCLLTKTSLTPIVCIGENRAERSAGKTRSVLKRQLNHAFKQVTVRRTVVIAYEPMWAISTSRGSKPMTARECRGAYEFIHEQCQRMGISRAHRTVLYGGSVSHDTIRPFVAKGVSDGALIGSASTDIVEFNALLRMLAKP